MSVHPELSAINRAYRRRQNAKDVLEEAAAAQARGYQKMAQYAESPEYRAVYARMARRYLFALVGDGRGEE